MLQREETCELVETGAANHISHRVLLPALELRCQDRYGFTLTPSTQHLIIKLTAFPASHVLLYLRSIITYTPSFNHYLCHMVILDQELFETYMASLSSSSEIAFCTVHSILLLMYPYINHIEFISATFKYLYFTCIINIFL